MAVLAIFTGHGFTKAMYEALRPKVKWETVHAPGGLFHAASFDKQGNIHVADVWESEDQMNAFVGTRLVPAFKELGIPMPEVQVYPVHNINVYPEAKKFILK